MTNESAINRMVGEKEYRKHPIKVTSSKLKYYLLLSTKS